MNQTAKPNNGWLLNEIFSGVWLWSLLLALVSVGLPILNERYRLGIPPGPLFLLELAAVTGLVALLGLSQALSPKKESPAKNVLRPMRPARQWACLLALILIDIAYSACLLYYSSNPAAAVWAWRGGGLFVDIVLLFIVFRLYFAKNENA
jgi:hypothetical protein